MKKWEMPGEELSDEDKRYLSGTHNKVIRYYYYLNRGVDVLNQFRNLFLGIFALYITLKLTNPLWVVAIVVVSSIVLTITGYYNVHKLSKMSEWLGLRFSSHYGLKNFNFQEYQCELMENILEELKKNGRN